MTSPAGEKLGLWRKDPALMVKELFAVTPDPWQKRVLRAFPTSKRIAMKASKGPGKSCVEAWCAWNFLITRLYPKVAATSVTQDNLADGLWTEMAKWREKSAFLKEAFEWTKTRIMSKEYPETWWMSARNWPKAADVSAQADTLAGLHADYILFILDEAGGIPSAVMATAEAALAGGIESKIMIGGNPTMLEGPLYDACTKERHKWVVVEVNGDPDDPDRSPRIDKQWARDQIEKYGRDNPWVKVNVFGEFPPGSINALIGPDDVAKAMKRYLRDDDYNWSQKRLGVDVSRFGDDATVLFPRQGLASFRPVVLRGVDSREIAMRVAQAKYDWGSDLEFIDDTGGYGSGVVDFLTAGGHSPVPINFSSRSILPQYYNKRSEMWFLMAEWIKNGGALPPDPELARELTTPTYMYTLNGKLRLEEKAHIKERLGYSPDRADALALTFAHPEIPKQDSMILGIKKLARGRNELAYDYDPLDDSVIG